MKIGLAICGPDLGYSPLALLSGTFEERLEKAARLGCDGVELMLRDPEGINWEAVKRRLHQLGLEVPQLITGELFGTDGLCLVTADDEVYRKAEERLQVVVDVAASLGAIVNIGRVRGQLRFLSPRTDAWAVAVERLRSIVAYAAAREVRIAFEPLNRYETDFILTVADGLRLIHELESPNVGLMLDLFHMNIEESSIENALRTAGQYLWHLHIADSNRRYPGSGHLNFESILATLKGMGYSGYLSGEMLPVPDPDTAAERTVAFLRACGVGAVRAVQHRLGF